ncbi:MAG TPA: STAS domain-containing protein [Phycisphaerae bacterium]|nr:STAS domain-containing protein [Phycisphaerae bacterium]HOB75207.1 STAS domain-containing protein [Phycisphaerae bacterium]HOJ54688.1 STAS domain-containing protein [Phycisphaerae bacterium]HOL25962.1 STAS domain-containing protein [Phycisphaerae bacterium]HPP19466.1 STAS domain-containing protein [Phycisphaerae bacterium]
MAGSGRLFIQPIRDVTVVNFADASILDAQQVQQIGEELYDLVDNKARRKIVLDFEKVRFLSSSALGVLIALRKKADAIKGRVVLCNLRNELREVFKITNLEKQFEFRDNEEQALGVFGVTTAG